MLVPIRDYLRPQDPQSSPLLCTTRDHFFRQLSTEIDPTIPGFEEARWVVSEDVNIEHLLEVFASVDPDMGDNWDACYHFKEHLFWHKPRQIILGSKIEALPDDHHCKPKCLSGLSHLFGRIGNYTEQKRLLNHTLELVRRLGDSSFIAQPLQYLSDVNRFLNLYEEGIRQAK